MLKITFILLINILSLHSNAWSQESVRPDVLNELQILQKMVVAKNFDQAFTKADELREKSNLNGLERKYLENINQQASLSNERFERAIVSLVFLQSYKPLSEDERLLYLERLAYANQRLRNNVEVAKWTKIYLAEKGSNQVIRNLYLQAVSETTQPEILINEANFLKGNLGFELTEAELRLLAVAHHKLKNEEGYLNTLTELIDRYSKEEYWKYLISQLTSQSNVPNKVLLDWYRLYVASGVMADSDDWLSYGELALKVGLPYESREVLKAYKVKGIKVTLEQSNAFSALEKRVINAVVDDEKYLKNISQVSTKDSDLIQFADLNFAKKNWIQAIDSYKKLITKADQKQRGWINLHLGIAYFYAGDAESAAKQFSMTEQDRQVARLNHFWLKLSKQINPSFLNQKIR